MNAFDFVVAVAFGSTLATILLSKDVAFVEGATALLLLTALQFAVAWLSVKWPPFRRSVTAQPMVLVSNGAISENAIRSSRVTESQVMQAVRSGGFRDIALVGAVVLEPNGSLRVIGRDSMGDGGALPSL